MEKDLKASYNRLKKEYIEAERTFLDEKDCLRRVIRTFWTVISVNEGAEPELELIKKMVETDPALPIDMVDVELGKFKDKILERVSDPVRDDQDGVPVSAQDYCRALREVAAALSEEFYPLNQEMSQRASTIDFAWDENLKKEEFDRRVMSFLNFVDALNTLIEEDFKYVKGAFFTLLDQVKDLEKGLSAEFSGKEKLKRIAYFEMQVKNEMGSIADTFNIHRTIDEIKSTVVEKITNIKRLVQKRREEDTKRVMVAQENIQKLKGRIDDAEKALQHVTKQAEQFQVAAHKDGLTGLYNRKAFDMRIAEAIARLRKTGKDVCIILFDIDNFKDINDSLGHVAGDRVLEKVAMCLVKSFRQGDFLARYGGDEFVALVEGLNTEMAMERVQAFEKNLLRIRFTSRQKGDIFIDVSAGIALAKEDDTPAELIARADKGMYARKQGKKRKRSDRQEG